MNETRYIIFNRNAATADGWIHIVPKGELKNSAAGIVQVLDDQALDAMLANIAADKKRLGENWPGIYAGREHFIYNSDADSEALAWFKDFEKRADGIWASEEGLTDIGREALTNKRYKFTSFAADPADTEKLGNKRARILKIDTVGFTNNPRGKEMLKPITNKNFPGAPASAEVKANPTERTAKMKSIATKLGLSAEASEDSILEAVVKLQNRNTTLEPLEAENRTLKNRNTELEGEMCDALLDACGLDTKDAKRPRLRSGMVMLKNREERVAFLGDFGLKPGAKKATETKTRILNREDGNGGEQETAADETDDKAKSEKILNRANELKGQSPNRAFDSCWQQAQREQVATK